MNSIKIKSRYWLFIGGREYITIKMQVGDPGRQEIFYFTTWVIFPWMFTLQRLVELQVYVQCTFIHVHFSSQSHTGKNENDKSGIRDRKFKVVFCKGKQRHWKSKWCPERRFFRMGEIVSCFMRIGFIPGACPFTRRHSRFIGPPLICPLQAA